MKSNSPRNFRGKKIFYLSTKIDTFLSAVAFSFGLSFPRFLSSNLYTNSTRNRNETENERERFSFSICRWKRSWKVICIKITFPRKIGSLALYENSVKGQKSKRKSLNKSTIDNNRTQIVCQQCRNLRTIPKRMELTGVKSNLYYWLHTFMKILLSIQFCFSFASSHANFLFHLFGLRWDKIRLSINGNEAVRRAQCVSKLVTDWHICWWNIHSLWRHKKVARLSVENDEISFLFPLFIALDPSNPLMTFIFIRFSWKLFS